MAVLTPPVLTEDAFPFNGVAAEQADWQKMAKIFAPSGIVIDGAFGTSPDSFNGLVTENTVPDLSVIVGPMRVWVEGAFAEFGTLTQMALRDPPDPSNPRIDLVVVRARWTTSPGPDIELDWVTGVAQPVPTVPALTQVLGQTWELALAQVAVGAGATVIVQANIQDRRPFSSAPAPTRLPAAIAQAAMQLPFNQYTSWSPAAPFWVLPIGATSANITSINAGASNLPVSGALLLIEFQTTCTVVNGANLVLRGNFAAVAGDYLLLYSDGSVWREVTRSRPLSGPVAAHTVQIGPTTGADAAPTQRLLLSDDMPAGPGAPSLMASDPGIDNGRLAVNVVRAPNLCINPGYEIWQRGNGPFTADQAFTADRHQIHLAGTDTLTVNADTTQHDIGSAKSARLDFTLGSGAGASRHTQYLKPSADNQTAVLQQTLTYAVRFKLNAAGNTVCRVGISWDGGSANTVYSPTYNANTTDWQTLVVTATTAGSPAFVEVGLWLANSNTIWVDNEVLVVGTVAPQFSGRLYQEDLYQCQRYYEVLGANNAGELIISGIATAGAQRVYNTYFWKVPKGGSTIVGPAGTLASIKQGTWNKTNCSEPVADAVDVSGVRLNTDASAAGAFFAHNGAANANLTGIWTP